MTWQWYDGHRTLAKIWRQLQITIATYPHHTLSASRNKYLQPHAGLRCFLVRVGMIPEAEDEQLREVIYREYRIMYHVDEMDEEVLMLTVLHSSRQFGGFE